MRRIEEGNAGSAMACLWGRVGKRVIEIENGDPEAKPSITRSEP